MNKSIAAVTAVLILAAAAGCGSNSKTAGTGKLKIAVIPKGTTHVFWKSIHAGAAKAASETGCEIIWQGPHKEDDRQMQIQVVQNFTSRKVDAIVLAPLDDRALVSPVSGAVKRGIPVVIIDSDLQSPDYSSFVATDNYAGGKLCAQRLCSLTGGKGRVIMLRYAEGSASTANREQGFLDGLKEFGPDIEILSSSQYAGATIEKAFQAAQNLLNRHPDVEAVFCPNESSTQGMLRALETAGRAGKVIFVGFDCNETLLGAMKEQKIQGLALQDPFNMGYMGVKTAVSVTKNESVEKRVDTGVKMLTPENMQDQAMQDLINPPLETWLGKQ